ncbi:MAG: hypothetical protein WCJ56_12010 [bacterium]
MKNLHWLYAFSGVALLAMLSLGTALLAAGPADDKKLHVSSPHIVSNVQEGNVRITTVSTATITQGDSVFSAANIVIRSTDGVHEFTCTGNPLFTDPQVKITGDKVIGYSSPRRAEFTENVKMIATPKKRESDSGKFINTPSTTTCKSLSYDYGAKRALAKDNVVITQPEQKRTVWADEGTYEEASQLITLRGNVKMKNEGEGEIRDLSNAETVSVSLKTDWMEIVGKDNGNIELNLDIKDEGKK